MISSSFSFPRVTFVAQAAQTHGILDEESERNRITRVHAAWGKPANLENKTGRMIAPEIRVVLPVVVCARRVSYHGRERSEAQSLVGVSLEALSLLPCPQGLVRVAGRRLQGAVQVVRMWDVHHAWAWVELGGSGCCSAFIASKVRGRIRRTRPGARQDGVQSWSNFRLLDNRTETNRSREREKGQ